MKKTLITLLVASALSSSVFALSKTSSVYAGYTLQFRDLTQTQNGTTVKTPYKYKQDGKEVNENTMSHGFDVNYTYKPYENFALQAGFVWATGDVRSELNKDKKGYQNVTHYAPYVNFVGVLPVAMGFNLFAAAGVSVNFNDATNYQDDKNEENISTIEIPGLLLSLGADYAVMDNLSVRFAVNYNHNGYLSASGKDKNDGETIDQKATGQSLAYLGLNLGLGFNF